ncbi:hypothetical protein BABA_15112 [Neobacillus bataviensis LMG 21833]|uniref:Oligosaccharide repeat unit polymerase n=1 Tax=Neobacillus bataviensis LMG 21833 TaxID=1117379 RepID=K6C5P2_9BACI|nr:O-antigen polymerase [Neobacillus bataviensis]EKN66450.1 hypothetical protein BABA_15112 [Neobacillus bataviensis LMG 21833]
MGIISVVGAITVFIMLVLVVIKVQFYKTPIFLIIIISFLILYLPPTLKYKELYISWKYLLNFYWMFFSALLFIVIGFSYKGKKASTIINSNIKKELKRTKKYLISAIILKLLCTLLSNFNGNNIIKALIFIFDDIATIFFFGYLWVLIASKRSFLLKVINIIFLVIIFYLENFINLFQGEEYSRYVLILPFLLLLIYFYEKVKEKAFLSITFIAVLLILITTFPFLNKGDLLIFSNATQVLEGLKNNITSFKPFLIIYSFGFFMIPDPFGIKPTFYTANGQFMLDILHFSQREVEIYPFGVGITGVADAYWNLGYIGIIIFFLSAGVFLRLLRNNALKTQSIFLYGIYILYVAKLFLLFRMDFSFFFGRLIIVIPLIYFITRSLNSENKFREPQ